MVLSDTELIQQARKGNMTAFEQLVQRYDEKVLSIASTYTNDSNDAKDIYQEVFIRVYKALPRFQFRSEFSTWLYRIATNVCLTFSANKKKRTVVPLAENLENEDGRATGGVLLENRDAPTDQQAIDGEIASAIKDALELLSPQQRLVFTLRHYEGYKLREIATMMGCAEGTVKKYLFTATHRLREQLQEVYS